MALTNATVNARKDAPNMLGGYCYCEVITLSGLTADLTASVPHSGPSGVEVYEFKYRVTTKPTDGSVVVLLDSDTDTTNNEVDVRFTTQAGGSLDGCVLDLTICFVEAAAQDGTSISTDTDD